MCVPILKSIGLELTSCDSNSDFRVFGDLDLDL